MTISTPISSPEVTSSNDRPNMLSLVSAQASKITNVSLYSGRAEITRSFKLALVEGQNQITIRRFPRTLQNDSVRVEGRGNASIHDVVISKIPLSSDTQDQSATSSAVPKRKLQELQNQIASAKHARSTLDAYLGTFNAENVAMSELSDRYASHAILARKLDNDILDLEHELIGLTESSKTPVVMTEKEDAKHLPWQVAINVWAQADAEEVEILIIYAVSSANWTASYDIRVDTHSSGKNIVIHYKAAIRQDTGESWVGVPLTLETVTPALGMVSPSLSSWILSEAKPELNVQKNPGLTMNPYSAGGWPQAYSTTFHTDDAPTSHARDIPLATVSRRSKPTSAMEHRPVIVATNKGDVTATFQIPGYIDVPSDAQQHNVTISSFEFKAPLLWYTFPKANARVYMEAKIQNESDYAFITGTANIYVDGSFVATTSAPAVSPQETFSCPLGLDSSLRVTYHRQEVNNSMTGFYKKSVMKTYTQRITVVNTKSIPIENLKVVDMIPGSQDERIEIKLLNPPLPPSIAEDNTGKEQKPDRIRVSPGVVALWDGANDPEVNQDVVGKNGRVRWDVSLRPQETVNLVLKFEVSYPEKLVVDGT